MSQIPFVVHISLHVSEIQKGKKPHQKGHCIKLFPVWFTLLDQTTPGCKDNDGSHSFTESNIIDKMYQFSRQ